MDTRYRLRAYTPPRLSPAGSLRAVTALSSAPTPAMPTATRSTQTATSAGGPAALSVAGEERALAPVQASSAARSLARPKMPKTGRGGQAELAPAAQPLTAPITVLALAAGLVATADDWGRARRRRRDCWRWYAPPPAERADQPG